MQRSNTSNDVCKAFPIELLLPVSQVTGEEDLSELDREPETMKNMDLYQQAVPLLHPCSTSAIRTAGKMLNDHNIPKRILQRSQSMLDHTSSVASSGEKKLDLYKACDQMFREFEPKCVREGSIPLTRFKILLKHYHLKVDEVKYRQWEQSLLSNGNTVTLLQFINACITWFGESHVINHYAKWLERKKTSNLSSTDGPVFNHSQSAPQLHPFDEMAKKHEETLSFSYKEYAASHPASGVKTVTEINAIKSHAILQATHKFRSSRKLLSKLESRRSLVEADDQVTNEIEPIPLHDHLHREKLAKHILQRCADHATATSTSNRKKDSTTPIHNNQNQRMQEHSLKKARQQSMEIARAFSTSVAMIARHVQQEDLRDKREQNRDKQLAIVEERNELRRLQRAHFHAMELEKSEHRTRELTGMKMIAKEETALAKQHDLQRQEYVRSQKPSFSMSPSTSTLFTPPPDILAAKASAKTSKERRQVREMEKEHLEHVRTIQLMDYAYQTRKAQIEAHRPKADAALVELDVERWPEAQELQIATEELWQEVLADCAVRQDYSSLIATSNSSPAALRFYGTSRPIILPPFTSSTLTSDPVHKVP